MASLDDPSRHCFYDQNIQRIRSSLNGRRAGGGIVEQVHRSNWQKWYKQRDATDRKSAAESDKPIKMNETHHVNYVGCD